MNLYLNKDCWNDYSLNKERESIKRALNYNLKDLHSNKPIRNCLRCNQSSSRTVTSSQMSLALRIIAMTALL